jgi:glycosyltransferase involved in cell wall biosynthesis
LTSTFPRWKNDPEPAFVYELNRRLKNCFDITVLTPRTPGSQDKEIMEGLKVIRYPYFFRSWENIASHSGGILNQLRVNPFNFLVIPFFLSGQLWATIRLLRQERFDVIHAHWIIPQGLIAAIAMMFVKYSIPMVSTSHGGDLYALKGKLFQKLRLWVIKKSRVLTVVSRAMKDILLDTGICSANIRVISMGVDFKNRFVSVSNKTRSSRELLFVGRLVKKKGLNVLIKAMPIVLDKYPDVHLTVVGSGTLMYNLLKQCKTLGISNKINFIGSKPQSILPDLYQKASLAIFPSRGQEGLGLVVLEAIGCGCPVIASDLPAIRGIVVHEKTGLVVPPGNPEALADTILFALQHSEKMEKMADQALKSVVQRFDWDVVTEKYERLLRREIKK